MMPPAKDLTGKVFGYWHVDEKTDRRDSTGSIIWACTCKCGKKDEVAGRHLTSLQSQSCGCLKTELFVKRTQRDLTNMPFGKLRAVRKTDLRKNGSVVWECECKCGNIAYVRSASLVQGNTKSCGCLNATQSRKNLLDRLSVDIVDGTKLSALNSTPPSDNTSGVRGVNYERNTRRWRASIGFKGVVYDLGSYDHLEQAAKARKAAEEIIWKPFLEERLGEYQDETEMKAKLRTYLQTKIAEQFLTVPSA